MLLRARCVRPARCSSKPSGSVCCGNDMRVCAVRGARQAGSISRFTTASCTGSAAATQVRYTLRHALCDVKRVFALAFAARGRVNDAKGSLSAPGFGSWVADPFSRRCAAPHQSATCCASDGAQSNAPRVRARARVPRDGRAGVPSQLADVSAAASALRTIALDAVTSPARSAMRKQGSLTPRTRPEGVHSGGSARS